VDVKMRILAAREQRKGGVAGSTAEFGDDARSGLGKIDARPISGFTQRRTSVLSTSASCARVIPPCRQLRQGCTSGNSSLSQLRSLYMVSATLL
jgi:hypothetical protein